MVNEPQNNCKNIDPDTSKYIASLTMVNPKKLKTIKTNQKPWKTMKIPWKIMKTKQKSWITKTSKHIVSDCEVQIIALVAMVTCVQKHRYDIALKRRPWPSHRHNIFTIAPIYYAWRNHNGIWNQLEACGCNPLVCVVRSGFLWKWNFRWNTISHN